jgi:ubiquinone/menaquinone biosynthesis C-methylase UbiE
MKKFPELYSSLANIVRHHTNTSHPSILDLGAGPGLLSAEILRQIPHVTVIGIDPLRTMLHLAQKNVQQSSPGAFTPVLGVSENIPLKDKSVDTIVSRFSLPYWTKPSQSFSEMHRILKPGGKIVFEALNRDFPKWKLMMIKIHMLFNKAGPDVTKYHVDAYRLAHTQKQVEQFFTEARFIILEKKGKKNEWNFIIVAQKK